MSAVFRADPQRKQTFFCILTSQKNVDLLSDNMYFLYFFRFFSKNLFSCTLIKDHCFGILLMWLIQKKKKKMFVFTGIVKEVLIALLSNMVCAGLVFAL